jgi:dTDP-4-dehydrorhamnose reductase
VLAVLRDRGGMEVVADEAGSPTFAGDLAEGLVALSETGEGGVFHLANQGRATRWELARAVARLAGVDPEAVRPTTTAAFLEKYPLPAKRPADSELRNLRAASLGVSMRPWDEALASYMPRLVEELSRTG